jgi:His-Xaa-Ser system radical SAM maturase HxsC
MLKLNGRVIHIAEADTRTPACLKPNQTNSPRMLLPLVAGSRFVTMETSRASAFLLTDDAVPNGYAHYLVLERDAHKHSPQSLDAPFTVLPNEMSYLADGDIIRLDSLRSSVRVLFRRASPHNTVMLTEQCQHYCLMCSQPPKNVDDTWLYDEANALIRLIPQFTGMLGFTGGEPTLYGDRFLETLGLAKALLPRTKLHVLSNGRTFSNRDFARRYAAIEHPDLTVGIPLYSDDPAIHDYIVQCKGAFDETVRGILNLKELGQKVEIRVVLLRLNVGRLENLATFLARNLLFVDHVALMGLEMTGFARANMNALWTDPHDYRDALSGAVRILENYGMHVSVYNHQLCIVNDDIGQAYRRSISDWKNEYLDACAPCTRKHLCGGFFSSGVQHRHSAHIQPFLPAS